MRNIGAYLLRHANVAAVVVLIATLLPFFGVPIAWLAYVILAFVTLRQGPTKGGYLLVAALLPLVIMTFSGYWSLSLAVVLASVLLLFVVAIVLQRTASWALAAETAAIVATVAVIAIHLWLPHVDQWWLAKFKVMLPQLTSQFGGSVDAGRINMLTHLMAKVATGMQLALLAVKTLFYLFLARWWQAIMFNPGGLRQEAYALRIGRIFSGLMLLAIVIGAFVHSGIAIDILPTLVLPFALAGLSLVHALAARNKHGWGIVIAMYVLLFFMLPYVVGLLVLAALVDSWYDFRSKYQVER